MAMKLMLMFLTVAIMATSIAEAQNPIGIVHVNGTLYCSSNGSPGGNVNAPVFSGARVQIACSADVIANAPENATTSSNGVYLVVLIPRPSATVSSMVANCRLFVLTPLSDCIATLPSVGLVSDLRFVKTVPVGFWSLTYMVAAGFSLRT